MSDLSDKITAQDIAPTILPDAFLDSDAARAIVGFSMPRYADIPDVGLYCEQVIHYIEQALSPLDGCSEGPWISPSMVNNYVKSGLIASPAKKLYSREHIARLLVICIFKQVLTIQAISSLFRIQKMTYMTDIAYNYVAAELESALKAVFSASREPNRDSASRVTRESLLVRNAVTAFAAKAQLVAYISFIGYDEE